MKSRIQRVWAVVSRFKLRGIYFLVLNKLNSKKLLRGIVSLRFPGIKHRVFLRTGTSDFQLFRNIFIEGEYNIHLPFTPKTIIDGGGNIGLAAITFANKYPDAKIVSVEPEDSNYAILQKNIAGYDNISSVKAGIWPRSSFLKVTNTSSGKWAFTIEETDQPDEQSIKALSITDIVHDNGWDSADLVKLDIEGSEKELFENNAREWLTRAKALIIELHDWIKPRCSDAVQKAISPFNFRKFSSGENEVFILDHHLPTTGNSEIRNRVHP